MPSILAQSMACAWALAAVDKTTPQAARSLITRMVMVLRDLGTSAYGLTVGLKPAALDGFAKPTSATVCCRRTLRVRVKCASPLTAHDAPINADARSRA